MPHHAVGATTQDQCTNIDLAPSVAGCAIIGLGVLGSQTADRVVRIPGIGAMTLIDLDRYDASNIAAQLIGTDDVGLKKVDAQQRRLKAIDRSLRIKKFARPVEEVPLAYLRGLAILGCVDNLATRIYLNEIAWRLGTVYIDAGVQAVGGTWARTTIYVPGAGHPCVECGLSQDDYDAATTNHPCQRGHATTPAPTGASAGLGAVAAGMQSLEVEKLMSGGAGGLTADHEIVLDLRSYRLTKSALWPNPACRFDHETWDIVPLPTTLKDLTVERTLMLPWTGTPTGGIPADASLRLAGRRFCLRIQCEDGHPRDFVHVLSTLKEVRRRCRVCRRPIMVSGIDLVDRLTPNLLSREILAMGLNRIGVRRGDIISVNGPRGEVHYEIPGSAR